MSIKKSATLFLFLILLVLEIGYSQKTYQPTWESFDGRPVPSWFEKNAKYGIFIHWGLYSVPAYSLTARDKVGGYDRYAEHYWRHWTELSSTQKNFKDFQNRVYVPDFKYQDFISSFKAEMYQSEEWAERLKASAVTSQTTLYFTKKGNNLYVIVTKWQNNPIIVEGISKLESVSMLGNNGKMKYSASGNKVTITPPVITPANNPCNYAWVFKVKNALKE